MAATHSLRVQRGVSGHNEGAEKDSMRKTPHSRFVRASLRRAYVCNALAYPMFIWATTGMSP